jgi:hypothetical protein
MFSIFKGISVDVSLVGIYLVIYRWVLGMQVSYWCAGGKGPRLEGGGVGGGVAIVPRGARGRLGRGAIASAGSPEKGWYP